jgi:outer membrane receptor protein involved in Fe transport
MAGFKLNIASDSVTKAYFYPVAEARIELIPDALKLYAGFSGGMERTSLQSITEQNLYISSVMPWNYVSDKFKIYGGFQSNISRSFNFNGIISSSSYKNFPLFVTDTAAYLNNSFTLLYDDVNAVKLKGELEYIKSARLRLALSGTYNHYKTHEQQYAWYKPAFEFEFTGRYSLQDKIILTAKATVNGKVWALVPQPALIIDGPTESSYILEAEQINGWTDINLGAEYRFNKALSFWINFNNLANSKYYRWNNYRSYGFNLLGGASYSF